MKFNFFFISYTVIYAKYNHCYEISRDMPVRYFDGKEWKFMKPRNNVRTRAPRDTNISTELDWADLIKEIKDIDLQEPTTQMLPTCRAKIRTTTKVKTTTARTTTTKKRTTKKFTTKMTTSKITKRKTRPFTLPTKTTKATMKYSPPRCKLKLKTTTAMTIDPQFWQTKVFPSEDWINAWTRVRPTKKLRPVEQDFLVNPSHCKYKTETTTTTSTVDPLFWQHRIVTSEDWINIWTRVRPTMKPSTISIKKYTNKNLPVTSTKEPATTTVPVTKTKGPVRTTENPVKISGTQGDDRNGPEYWSNLMKEFLKYVDYKKCQPPCEYSATTHTPFSGYMLGGKRFRSGGDELANILMNDVEIDEKLSKVDDNASQGTAIMRFQETFEVDREQRLNSESIENFVSRDSKINNENEQYLDLLSFNDSVEVRRMKQDDETGFKSNYVIQDYETHSRVSRTESNFEELKDKNAIEEDEILLDSEINSYVDVLTDKHTKKEKDSQTTENNFDAENAGYTGKTQDEDIRKRLDAIKDTYTQRYKDSSHYVSKDPLNFKELNRIADYVATKRAHSTVSIEMRNDNDDFLQNDDMTFDLGTLEDNHEKANKYSAESIELRDLEVYTYGDTVQDVNVPKDEKTITSHENVIPLFNFKYPLNENITN